MTLAFDQLPGLVGGPSATDDFRVFRGGEPHKCTLTDIANAVALVLDMPPLVAIDLTDAAEIVTDGSLGRLFKVTIAGDRELSNPTNLVPGLLYTFHVTQDATGSRLLTYGTMFKFAAGTAPTLSTDPAATDVLSGVFDGTSFVVTSTTLDVG